MAKTKADIEQELIDTKKQLKAAMSAPPKEREAAETRATQARTAVKGISVETVVKDLTEVGLTTGRALANLSETLTAKTKQLEDIDLAIEVKTRDLETLYGKEVVESALASLLEDYDQQKQQLQAEITTLRHHWLEEQQAHAKAISERNTEVVQLRVREDDKFIYERDIRRRTEDTKWTNELEDRKRTEALRSAEFEHRSAGREASLAAREAEYNTAVARVAGIPAEIDAAVKKEVQIVANSITRDHKHATELASRDHAGEVAGLKSQVTAKQSELDRLVAQVADLNAKLATAYEKNVSLSEKALEAASGRQALTELRDLQTTRAENNGSKSKS